MQTKAWGPSTLHPVVAAGQTHVGRRGNNEDALLVSHEHGVFVVADGMGGYEGGEIASRIVIDSVRSFFERNARDEQITWPFGLEAGQSFVENLLSVALRLANREILRRRKGALGMMGSTAVALALDHTRLVIAHAGDSRAYRLREGTLERLTVDHSLVEQLRAMGTAEIPEGMGHIITKVLGGEADVRPDLRVIDARPDDTFLLCTDGLTDALDDAAIRDHLADHDPSRVCERLIDAAYRAGGADNITVLTLRVGA